MGLVNDSRLSTNNEIPRLGANLESALLYEAGLILGLLPANERRSYIVTTSLIGWAQA